MKTSEENLSKTIVEKEEAVSAAKTVVRKYEQDLKERGNDLASTLSKNKNKTNETVKKVIQKYPAEKNIFNRYVTHMKLQVVSIRLEKSTEKSFKLCLIHYLEKRK